MRAFYLGLANIVLFLFLSGSVFADTAHSISHVTPALDPPFKFSSYIEGSYNYLSRSNHFISGYNDRFNDVEPNGFTLQQAAAIISSQSTQGLSGLLSLLAGRDANSLAPYGMDISTGIKNIGFAIMQAYFQYTTPSFTTLGGEMDSLVGFENYNPIEDTNFSRSIISAYAQPGTFLGVRETYTPNSTFSFFVGANNGWDTIEDTVRRATFELGVIDTLSPQFSFSIQGFNGQQRATDGVTSGPTGIRNALDLVATYHATKKLSYAINYDYGIQNRAYLANGNLGEAVWQGMAGYINYAMNERWQTSLRGEIFSDHNGFRTGVQQTWKEATVTVAYLPIKHLTLRAETRRDFSNVKAFVDKNGHGVGNNLQSFALEMLYVFS